LICSISERVSSVAETGLGFRPPKTGHSGIVFVGGPQELVSRVDDHEGVTFIPDPGADLGQENPVIARVAAQVPDLRLVVERSAINLRSYI
jgi:hypothetical protein